MAYEMPCKEIFVRISARFGDILNIFANFALLYDNLIVGQA